MPQNTSPWYSEDAGFFGPEYLKQYEESGSLSNETTQKEVDFLEHILDLEKGSKILDCPCGHGRHSIELACRGYDVTGQDLNSFFIQKADEAAEQADVSVEWVTSDMRHVPYEEEFDVALNLFSSFGYLENEEEDQKALNQAARSLKQGGRFVLDTINRDRVIRTFTPRKWEELSDGSAILTKRDFEHRSGRHIEKRIKIDTNGQRSEFSLIHRWYTVPELVAMLEKAGLILQETYGNYEAGPITFDSSRYILIAGKPDTLM